ncbi:MAG: efflux RND transporter periplasmic adaptor subunit [Bryobacteraceae bacterium]|jgi:membrane fusion protein (multidrug efflux system)
MSFRNKHPKILLQAAGSFGLLGAILLAGCAASGQKPGPAQAPPPAVEVMEAEAADVPIFSEFAAQTYARDMVEVRGHVEGYIEKWNFRPGAEVAAGQTLYVLDLRPYEAAVEQAKGNLHQNEADLEFARKQVALLEAQANLASAQANLVKAQQDVDRLTPLVQADAASKQDLDAAEAALKANQANVNALKATVEQAGLSTRTQIASMQAKVEAQQAALNAAELNLRYGTILAPISGRIGDTLIPVGGLVTPASAQPLTTIVPLDPIWVRFKVTESEYLAWTHQGGLPSAALPLTLILADASQYGSVGHIENSLNQMDPKTATLELQARFPNPRHTMLPGQFGRVRVQVAERKNAILIPQKAVQQLQSVTTVFTVGRDNRVEVKPVTTGDRVGNSWIVERGLQPGDRVVVEGQQKVRVGNKVEPEPYRATETGPAAPRMAGN